MKGSRQGASLLERWSVTSNGSRIPRTRASLAFSFSKGRTDPCHWRLDAHAVGNLSRIDGGSQQHRRWACRDGQEPRLESQGQGQQQPTRRAPASDPRSLSHSPPARPPHRSSEHGSCGARVFPGVGVEGPSSRISGASSPSRDDDRMMSSVEAGGKASPSDVISRCPKVTLSNVPTSDEILDPVPASSTRRAHP